MRRTVVLGATGFLGRALVLALQGRGDQVCVLARSAERAKALLPAGIEAVELSDRRAVDACVAAADAVVNLAGESIAGKRWTKKRKRALVESRIETTRMVVDAIGRRDRELPVLVSASAVGWYGDRGDDEVDELDPAGDGFLAELCRDWEAAATTARAARVVRPRFGIVLGREGGALPPLLRLTRLGIAGPLGGGKQWVPWVHLEDAVGAVLWMLDSDVRGPVNVVAQSIRQRELAHAIGAALGRRAVVPTPGLALRLALGEQATMLLEGQHVIPRVLEAAGFPFRHRTIEDALASLVAEDVAIEAMKPGYVLHATTRLEAPLRDVFAFFSSPENLAALTPPSLAFQIVNQPDAMHDGALIDYKIRVAGVPMTWRTRIEQWRPGEVFVDTQERGPYRLWHHTHRFREDNGATVMEDIVRYRTPFGPLGGVFVRPMLRRIFAFRGDAIRLRFNAERDRPRA